MSIAKTKERITLTLPKVIIDRLKKEADESGMLPGVYAQLILLQYFKQADALGLMKGMESLLDKLSLAQLQQMQLESIEKGAGE